MRDVREVMREEMVMKGRIIDVMRDSPKTVPEVAQALESPTNEMMYWMMALRKYGLIAETEELTEEGYYKYKLVEG